MLAPRRGTNVKERAVGAFDFETSYKLLFRKRDKQPLRDTSHVMSTLRGMSVCEKVKHGIKEGAIP